MHVRIKATRTIYGDKHIPYESGVLIISTRGPYVALRICEGDWPHLTLKQAERLQAVLSDAIEELRAHKENSHCSAETIEYPTSLLAQGK